MAVLELERDEPGVLRFGAITPGKEKEHKALEENEQSILCFESACEVLFAPFLDDQGEIVRPSGVEVTTEDTRYVIAQDIDAHQNPTLTVMLHQGLRDHAISLIDTPVGKYVEQHEFRETYGLLREGESYMLEPAQYKVFDIIADAVIDPNAEFRVISFS